MTLIIDSRLSIHLTGSEAPALKGELERLVQLARDTGKFEIQKFPTLMNLRTHLAPLPNKV